MKPTGITGATVAASNGKRKFRRGCGEKIEEKTRALSATPIETPTTIIRPATVRSAEVTKPPAPGSHEMGDVTIIRPYSDSIPIPAEHSEARNNSELNLSSMSSSSPELGPAPEKLNSRVKNEGMRIAVKRET